MITKNWNQLVDENICVTQGVLGGADPRPRHRQTQTERSEWIGFAYLDYTQIK